MADQKESFQLAASSTLTTGVKDRYQAVSGGEVTRISGVVGTAPDGADLEIEIRKDTVAIATLVIADGETEGTVDVIPDLAQTNVTGGVYPADDNAALRVFAAGNTLDLNITQTGLANEVQSITEGGAGLTSFTLTYDGQTTASIDDDATAAQVQAALEALSNLAPGDVVVTGGPLGTAPMAAEFTGTLRGTDVDEMTATPTGGTGTVTIDTVTEGGSGTAGSDLDVTVEYTTV